MKNLLVPACALLILTGCGLAETAATGAAGAASEAEAARAARQQGDAIVDRLRTAEQQAAEQRAQAEVAATQ